MMNICFKLLHVILLTFVKYVVAPHTSRVNEALPLTAQQVYDFSSRNLEKTVRVKKGETIQLLQGTSFEVKIEYTFPKDEKESNAGKPFVMASEPDVNSVDHLINAKYTYTLCNRTNVIYNNRNAKLTSDMEIKTGRSFCVNIAKEGNSILVNNQQDLYELVQGDTYCLILKDDCDQYNVEIVKSNPHNKDDFYFEIKNSNETISGFILVKFPLGLYLLDSKVISCRNASLDVFFTYNENVLIAHKVISLLKHAYTHKTVFTTSNGNSVAEITKDTFLETNNLYEEKDAKELLDITKKLKASKCDAGTLHRLFYHYIYIKLHKLENMCKGIRSFLDEFEGNRNKFENELKYFLNCTDRNIAKQSHQLLIKCYIDCEL